MTPRGKLENNVSLHRYNTWRVGGAAKQLFVPADLSDLQDFLTTKSADEPVYWLGLGSNVLIRDGGFAGTVIVTNPGLSGLALHSDGTLEVQAGVPCAKVAKFAAKHGLTGAEFLVGIPGTMGGALAMNAGAFGGETWPIVTAVDVINSHGEIKRREAAEFSYGYRSIDGLAAVDGEPEEWFVTAYCRLEPGDAKVQGEKNKALLKKRGASQPIGLPSCGSVFRNPPGHYAAELIEACDLKGVKRGSCEISTKHANFIVHDGHGTAKDIESLIELIQSTVKERFDVTLECEVKRLGDR